MCIGCYASDLFSPLECPVGTYSDGGSPCEPCPANTQAGMAECPCLPEYYRAPDEVPSVPCTREPSIEYCTSATTNIHIPTVHLPIYM